MFNLVKKIWINLAMFGAILVPQLVLAADPVPAPAPATPAPATTVVTPVSSVTITNPLGTTDPRVIIANIIKAILSIVGSLALLMFVYGGVIWITSFGDAKRIDKGKTILTWTVLGLALIAAAYVLVNTVLLGLTTGSATGA